MGYQTDNHKGGAPARNRNRTLHGVRGWSTIGTYPKGCSHVRRYVGRLRAELEAGVLAVYGSISVYHAALIQSACRHEGRALLLTRWLRVEESLSVSDRLGILKETGNATDSRDKCIRSLGLAEPPEARDPWAALDATASEPSNAPESPAGHNGTQHPEPHTSAPAASQGGDTSGTGQADAAGGPA